MKKSKKKIKEKSLKGYISDEKHVFGRLNIKHEKRVPWTNIIRKRNSYIHFSKERKKESKKKIKKERKKGRKKERK